MTGGLLTDVPQADDNAIADARALGADEASIDALKATLFGEQQDGVWPENEPAVLAWLIVQTQWRVAAVGSLAGGGIVWLGLDYAAARAGLDAAGIDTTPALWSDLQIMEGAACELLNARSKGS